MRRDAGHGVDQSQNDRCSDIARRWARTTLPPAQDEDPGAGFAHSVATGLGPISITSDGIGTKIEVAERKARFDTLGFDLVAMVVDDLAAAGSLPVALSNILDVDRFDEAAVDALMRGLAEAARTAGVIVAGGEIACLGRRIGGHGPGMHANWCATAIGTPFHATQEPRQIRPPSAGDCILALASDGFRSNGYTLARSLLEASFGPDWHNAQRTSGERWGDSLLVPSRIYTPAVVALHSHRIPLSASVHITGGGIPGNLPRVLVGLELRAELDNLWTPHDAMLDLIRLGAITPADAYEHWNMGNGFLCILPPDAADEAIAVAADHGVRARVAGRLVDGHPGDVIAVDATACGLGRLEFGGDT